MTTPEPPFTPSPGGFGLSRERFGLLFAVMLVAAAGNTAMQSLLPSIGRALGVADLWVAIAFSLSAILWVVTAPHWARRADQRGRRALMRLGLSGFILSMLVCGSVLAAGLAGWLPGAAVFIVFTLGRAIYGGWGSASPSAVQAYVAARTEGEQRTAALAAIASSFGLGTIIGPAIAPLFIFPPLGLAAPLIVFAGIGATVLALLILRLPSDAPTGPAKGQVADFPVSGTTDDTSSVRLERSRETGAQRTGFSTSLETNGIGVQAASTTPLRWRDPRLWPWLVAGMVGGHGQAVVLGVMGFLVIDRLQLGPADAQHAIAVVLMGGAVAALLAQWWLIPQLHLTPRQLVTSGAVLAAAGAVLTGLAGSLYTLTLSFALASLGFGLFRPGFTSGASLSVAQDEQNNVAGKVTSVNGLPYLAGPPLGVALYGLGWSLPFLAVGALMLGVAGWTFFSLHPSRPDAE